MTMAEPKATGAYTDEQGALRCRATANRCLSHRQASELVGRARKHGRVGKAEHCSLCSAWHYHQQGKLQGGVPRPPNKVRQWRRQQGRR